MSFHRTVLVAFIALIATAFAPAAFAQCGGCGGPVAVTYVQPVPQVVYVPAPQPVVYAQPTCGGCGCGGCANFAAVPVAPAPIAVDHWDTGGYVGCGGCGCNSCGSTFGYQPVVPSSLYVVNQGPEYSGPGIMRPYGTYSPDTGLANAAEYPNVSGPGYGYGPHRAYHGPHYAYRPHYWHRYGYHGWRG
jgi:hypothetical protein